MKIQFKSIYYSSFALTVQFANQ